MKIRNWKLEINIFRALSKNRSLGVIFLGILVAAAAVIYFKMIAPNLSDAAWFDDNYLYRQKITFTHNANITSDRRISVSVDTATLITNNKMQSDCDDTRFSDANGKVLKYQLTGTCNNAATTYDVVFPAVYNGTNEGYIYYGNPSATSASQDVSATTSLSPSGGAPTVGTEQQAITPIVYYKFDEGTGTTAYDATADGFNGTLNGSLSYQTEDQCVSGKCLLFDGSTQYVTKANDSRLTPAAITLGLWVRPIALPTSGNVAGVVDKRDNTTYSAGYQLQLVNDSGTQKIRFYMGPNYIDATYTLPLDQWTYLTVSLNGTTATIYVNGQAQVFQATGYLTNYATALLVGKNSSGNFYNGFIDEFKIYNYARSTAQVKTDFTARASRDGTSTLTSYTPNNNPAALNNGLVGYWKMDQSSWNGTSGEAVDSSGNANNGTAQGGATTGAGKFGNGGALDGTNDYVTVPNSSSNSISGSLTIATWVKVTTNKNYNQIITKGADAAENYEMLIDSSGLLIGAWLFNTGRSACIPGAGVATPSTGTWFHVAVVYDSVKTTCKTYINGALSGTVTSGIGSSLTTNSSAVEIGGDTSVAGRYFGGTIDETRIYNRALSDADVANLANFAPGPMTYYDFEEGSGAVLHDKSGNGYNGTINNSPTWINGKYGKALQFNGSNQNVTVAGWGNNAPKQDITISFWINATNDGSFHNVMWTGTDTPDRINIHFPWNGGQIYWDFGTCCTPRVTYTPTGYNNTWTHFEVVSSYQGGYMRIYKNGVLEASNTAPGTFTPGNYILYLASAAGNQYLNGALDEFKIYNYARTPTQIIQDMNGGHPTGGSPVGSAVGYWKFDEGQGTTANNSGSKGATLVGTLTNFSSPATSASGWTQAGKFGKALNFSSSGTNYITVPSDASLNFNPSTNGDFTISAWIKPNVNSASQAIVTKGDGASTDDEYIFEVARSSAGTISLFYRGSWRDSTTTPIVGNTWQHVAAVVTNSGTTITFYYNGAQTGTSITGISGTYGPTLTTAVYIGKQGPNATNYFNGSLDEIKIYGGALTPDQIKIDYNRGSAQVLGAAGTGDVPPTISNLGLWLDANDASTVTIATGVSAWADKSGNGRNMAQATGSKQPAYTPGILNSKPVLRFTAASSQTMTNSTNFTTPVSVLYVVRQTGGANQRMLSGLANNWLLGYWSGGKNQAYFEGWVSASGTPATDTSWHIYEAVETGSLSTVYADGTQTDSNASGLAGPNGLSLVGYQGTSEFSNGDIAEVLVYSKALSTAERQKIEGYLANKWGLQANLPSTHPYSNTPPNISSFSAGSTYCPPGDNCAPPMLEYLFEEGSGSSAKDTSGNGYTGTLNNSPTWVPGVHGKALKFNGSNQNVTVASWGNNAPSKDITISFWVKSANYDATGRNVMWLGADTPDRINIHFPWSNGNIYWDFGTCCTPRLTYTPTGWADTWTHFTVVHSNAGGYMRIYKNGVLESSGTNVGTFTPGNYTLYVGSGSATAYLNGALDDFRIYPYARTPAEIAWEYNRGGPIGWWKMDECQGLTANDASGNSQTGTIVIGASGTQTAAGSCNTSATTAWYSGRTGKLNYSLNFDGTDDYITVPYNARQDVTTASFGGWIKTTYTTNQVVMSKYNGGVQAGILFRVLSNGQISYHDGQAFTLASNRTGLNDGNWHHIFYVQESATNHKLYIDGALDATSTTSSSIVNHSDVLLIGAYKVSSSPAGFFQGQLDDIRFYNYALTPFQVKTLMNEGPVRYAPLTGAP